MYTLAILLALEINFELEKEQILFYEIVEIKLEI